MLVSSKPRSKAELTALRTINRVLLYPGKPPACHYNHRGTPLLTTAAASQQQFDIRENQLNSKFMARKRRLESISR